MRRWLTEFLPPRHDEVVQPLPALDTCIDPVERDTGIDRPLNGIHCLLQTRVPRPMDDTAGTGSDPRRRSGRARNGKPCASAARGMTSPKDVSLSMRRRVACRFAFAAG